MNYGSVSSSSRVKLFAIEDFWGNIYEWIDGVYYNAYKQLLTATDNFNTYSTGYINQGQIATEDLYGYMSKPQGTSETGFLPKEVIGSETTYFCDSTNLEANSSMAYFGGYGTSNNQAGIFCMSIQYSSGNAFGARLMYL